MDRRTALRNIAVLVGASPLTAFAIENFNPSKNGLNKTFFAINEQNTIADIAEIIIPTTSTPGAKAAGVPAFIEMMIQECYRKSEQEIFKKGLQSVETKAKTLGNSFAELSADAKNSILTELEAEALKNQTRIPTFWQLIKELTLIGYFTSEIGMTKAMIYEPIPGRIENIKIKKGQKSYSQYIERFR